MIEPEITFATDELSDEIHTLISEALESADENGRVTQLDRDRITMNNHPTESIENTITIEIPEGCITIEYEK